MQNIIKEIDQLSIPDYLNLMVAKTLIIENKRPNRNVNPRFGLIIHNLMLEKS